MTIVILDESKKRKKEMQDLLQAKGYSVIVCSGTGEFIETIQNMKPDKIFLDVESWYHGRSIFNFFKFQKQLELFPIICYYASNHYKGLPERAAHPQDKICTRDKPVDMIVSEGV